MNLNSKRIAFEGILAAVYAALTLATSSFAYGPIQFRIAEALAVLCCFTPAAVPGLVVGCMAANLFSFVSIWDFFIGSAATLLACLLTRRFAEPLKRRGWLAWLVPLPTILCNAVIVGAEIAFFFQERDLSFFAAWGLNGLSVGLGETVVLYALGVPLLLWLRGEKGYGKALEAL